MLNETSTAHLINDIAKNCACFIVKIVV